jgi:hypothetical protein
MQDKAFLYYLSSWNSGYPLMYYVLGGLVHVSFVRLCLVDFVVLLIGLQAPSVPSVLVHFTIWVPSLSLMFGCMHSISRDTNTKTYSYEVAFQEVHKRFAAALGRLTTIAIY